MLGSLDIVFKKHDEAFPSTPKHLNVEAHEKQAIYIEYKIRKC